MILAKRIAVIFLSLLTFSYSGGIAITKHYCKHKIVSKAINSEVKKCSKAVAFTPFSKESQVQKPNCCSTDFAFFKSNDFEKTSKIIFADFTALEPQQTAPVFVSYQNNRAERFKSSPPLPNLPIYIFVESYLI